MARNVLGLEIASLDDHAAAERLFVRTGVLWQTLTASYWVLLFTRVVVELDFPAVQLLLLGTAKEVTILAAEIPTGVVADLRSRRLSVILGFSFAGIGIVMAGVVNSFALMALAQVIWGFGNTFRSGAETAWVTDELGSSEAVEPLLIHRARRGLLGVVVGVAASMLIVEVSSMSTALVVVGALLIGWAAVLIATMPETGFVRTTGSPARRFVRILRVGASTTRQTPPLRRLFIVVALAGFGSEAVDRLFVARFAQIGLPDVPTEATLVGAIAIVQALLGAGMLAATRSRLHGDNLVPWLAALHIGTAVGVVLLSQGNLLAVAMLGLVTTGTLRAVARPIVEAWTNHFAASEQRATIHSFLGQAQSFGEITGGIGLGVIATSFGISTALVVSAIAYAFAAALAASARRLWDRPRPRFRPSV